METVHAFLKTQRLSGRLLLCLVLFWASLFSSMIGFISFPFPSNGVVIFSLSLTDGCYPAYQTCGSLIVRRCTSCCSPDWAPRRGGLVWSGTCRLGTDGGRQSGLCYNCCFHAVFILALWLSYCRSLTQHRAAPAGCLEKGWWGCMTVCCLGLSSHLTQEGERLERQEIKKAQDTEQTEPHPFKRQKD